MADNDRELDIRHALVPYPPLYPTFQESLDRFRQGEREELHRRGAEQVFHNVELYNTRQSSEDGNADLVPVLPEDIPPLAPQEQQVEGGERPDPSQEVNEVPPHQADDNNQPDDDTMAVALPPVDVKSYPNSVSPCPIISHKIAKGDRRALPVPALPVQCELLMVRNHDVTLVTRDQKDDSPMRQEKLMGCCDRSDR